jgi:hypothetical protein
MLKARRGASHPFSKPLHAFLGGCCRGDCRCTGPHVAVLRVPALAVDDYEARARQPTEGCGRCALTWRQERSTSSCQLLGRNKSTIIGCADSLAGVAGPVPAVGAARAAFITIRPALGVAPSPLRQAEAVLVESGDGLPMKCELPGLLLHRVSFRWPWDGRVNAILS